MFLFSAESKRLKLENHFLHSGEKADLKWKQQISNTRLPAAKSSVRPRVTAFLVFRLLIDNCRNTNAAFNVGCFDPKIATEQYM